MKSRIIFIAIALFGALFVGCEDDPLVIDTPQDTIIPRDTISEPSWDTISPISVSDSLEAKLNGIFNRNILWEEPDTLWVIGDQRSLDSFAAVYTSDSTIVEFDFTNASIILCRVTYPSTAYELTNYYLLSNGTNCKFHTFVSEVQPSGYQAIRSQLFWVSYPNICNEIRLEVNPN